MIMDSLSDIKLYAKVPSENDICCRLKALEYVPDNSTIAVSFNTIVSEYTFTKKYSTGRYNIMYTGKLYSDGTFRCSYKKKGKLHENSMNYSEFTSKAELGDIIIRSVKIPPIASTSDELSVLK